MAAPALASPSPRNSGSPAFPAWPPGTSPSTAHVSEEAEPGEIPHPGVVSFSAVILLSLHQERQLRPTALFRWKYASNCAHLRCGPSGARRVVCLEGNAATGSFSPAASARGGASSPVQCHYVSRKVLSKGGMLTGFGIAQLLWPLLPRDRSGGPGGYRWGF